MGNRLGAEEGPSEGADEGFKELVGCEECISVGCDDGVCEGFDVGCNDGVSEGFDDGSVDGVVVGFAVGPWVGDSVLIDGLADGLGVGSERVGLADKVGSDESALVGPPVGEVVGYCVGFAVGSWVGDSVLIDGLADGLGVGSERVGFGDKVGAEEGLLVGNVDGAMVRRDVGAALGKDVMANSMFCS